MDRGLYAWTSEVHRERKSKKTNLITSFPTVNSVPAQLDHLAMELWASGLPLTIRRNSSYTFQ